MEKAHLAELDTEQIVQRFQTVDFTEETLQSRFHRVGRTFYLRNTEMTRLSERLISLGYYDEGDKPKVSYKENLKRIFQRKRRSQFGSPGTPNPEPAVDDTRCHTPLSLSATNANLSVNDLERSSCSDTVNTSIADEWETPLTTSFMIMDEARDPSVAALDTTELEVAYDNDQQTLKKFLLRGISVFLLAVLLCSAVSLNSGSLLLQMQTFNSGLWESRYSDFEALKEVQTNLKQLQEELFRLRNKLLPEGLSMPNFALESQGARVLDAYPSESYHSPSLPPLVTFLCKAFLYPVYSPRTIIQFVEYRGKHPSIRGHTEALVPGRCWSFAGHQGHLFISLSQPVAMSHVTLGHISREHAPYGFVYSAPQHFSVSGFLSENGEGTHLGDFEYDPEGESFQTFELFGPTQTYRYVRLEILSNWGHPEYTCVYSFKVHGKIK
ncbi:sperm-associated antigen 4 protein-like [Boleophthalmus pectinirostris]|uniref:sperm-associated antigen 4 protein-like n=1 Tax=Boleophthalmus pectinirostris TaxID=150288 RepID=UPI00242DEC45|nr:sperm-associated antigen 4 protein-like [Boleophthalmus pectinirostris]